MSLKKVIAVTGANRGIGFGIIETFCKTNNFLNKALILTSRNKDKGLTALETLRVKYPNAKDNLFYMELDVTKTESRDKFKEKVVKDFKHINVLYNNAAILHRNPPKGDKKRRESELLETFDTNVFGLISLTELLIPIFNSPAQVINLSSELGRLRFDPKIIAKFEREDIEIDQLDKIFEEYRESFINETLEKTGWDDRTPEYGCYGVSKVFVNAYTKLLDRRLKKKGIKIHVNAVSPGWTNTEMGGKEAPREYLKGAETPVWMEETFPDDNFEEYSGKFFKDKKQISWKLEGDFNFQNKHDKS